MPKYDFHEVAFFKISIKCGVSGDFAFLQNFQTRKLGEILVFCAVKGKSLHYDLWSSSKENNALSYLKKETGYVTRTKTRR